MLNELRCIEMRVKAAVFLQRVPNSFIAAHAVAPDGAPVGVAETALGGLAKRLEALAFDADERRLRDYKAVEHRMTSTAPWKANRRFQGQ